MPSKYLLPCDHCSHPFEVIPKQAGQELTCPECGKVSEAPMLRKMRLLEPVEDETVGKTNKRVEKSSKFNRLFSIGLFAAVLLGGSGYWLYGYAGMLATEIDRELSTEQHNEFVDQLQPSQVITYFNELRIDNGLGEWYEPNYVRYNKQSEILTNTSYVLMGLGGLFLACSISMVALIAFKR
ncbi:MAG: zinc ribbon domain-containing protein [Planctomycetaceae bacterium]|nr:zinc ribbon domain-containing protein [Planctomycetaceae bacterium]MCP4478358.1 zinc ribbon domain-containing protein [Planctomycetaceae bacterium]MCP4775204.1 zinc ribbon domain-containing protein [Planctomycetaceae bacterium]